MNKIIFIIICILILSSVRTFSLSKESDHFIIIYQPQDETVTDTILSVLEVNYYDITSKLELTLTSKTNIYVYPNLSEFHQAIGMPDAPDWLVGMGRTDIRMVSPLNPGSVHSYSFMLNPVLTHEFTHICTEKISYSLPLWMIEGYACYTAGPFASETGVKEAYNNQGKIPTLNELSNFSNFASYGGYQFSYTIVRYIDETFGFNAIIDFMHDPDNFSVFNGLSKDEFEGEWQGFVNTEYLEITQINKFLYEQNKSVLLFPNPFSDIVTLNWNNENQGKFKIYVYNMDGKLIYSLVADSGTNNLNFGFLPKGLYLFSIVHNNILINKKMIKE